MWRRASPYQSGSLDLPSGPQAFERFERGTHHVIWTDAEVLQRLGCSRSVQASGARLVVRVVQVKRVMQVLLVKRVVQVKRVMQVKRVVRYGGNEGERK